MLELAHNIHDRIPHPCVLKACDCSHYERIADEVFDLLAAVHVPYCALGSRRQHGTIGLRILAHRRGDTLRSTHLASRFQRSLGSPVLGRRLDQVRPVHQCIGKQVSIQLVRATLQLLEGLLTNQGVAHLSPDELPVFIRYPIERHIEFRLPQVASRAVNQAGLLGHIQRVLLELVEHAVCIGIDHRTIARHLAFERPGLNGVVKLRRASCKALTGCNVLRRKEVFTILLR